MVSIYDFEIIHRAGRIHGNVDGLSRPVLPPDEENFRLMRISLEMEETRVKPDIFLDEPLLFYIKNGRHMDGRSRRGVSRVLKESEKYRFENNKILFLGDGQVREVPPIESRKEIVSQAHLLGHFKVETTYNRLKEKYWWQRMKDDIIYVINNCGPCVRNSKSKVWNHPAMAIRVTGIFETLHIDCVWGLTPDKYGYHGIFTLCESMSGYPGGYPLKTKTKEEIAKNLTNWVCLWGPPKAIVSDQGPEFVNDVIDGFCKGMGIPHKLTAVYNPRTNGKVERLNQTLISSLRCMAEENPGNWTDHLDFVLFSIRTRENKSGFSPFEILHKIFRTECSVSVGSIPGFRFNFKIR